MICLKTFLNIFPSIPQIKVFSKALIEPDLGALYNKATSPKESPLISSFIGFSLISTNNFPDSIKKNEDAISFYLKRYSF